MSDPLWINAASDTSVGTAIIESDNDLFTITAHGLSEGDLVVVSSLTGSASTVLADGGVYWVRDVTSDTFAISLTKGGTVIGFSADGGADVNRYQPGYSAAELRRAMGGLVTSGLVPGQPGGSNGFAIRQGLFPHSFSGEAISSVSAGTWTTRDFTATVYPEATTQSGGYIVQMPADSGTYNPADDTFARIDAIDLQIRDDDEDSSGFRDARLVYNPGTPAASPVAPALTDNSLRLGTWQVNVGGSISNQTHATVTVARGGIIPIRDSAELPDAGRWPGLTVWDIAREELQVNESGGAAWHVVASVGGWQRISNGVSDGSSQVDIDLTAGGKFPAGTFDTIRIRATGYLETAGQLIHAQINGQTGGNYRFRRTVLKMTNGPALSGSAGDSSTSWHVGIWGTLTPNSLLLELYRCVDNVAIPYYATSGNHNSDGEWFIGVGRYNSAIVPSSVRIFPAAGTFGLSDGFVWELEGYRK